MEAVFVYTTKQIQLKVNVICSSLKRRHCLKQLNAFIQDYIFWQVLTVVLSFKSALTKG